MVKRFFEFRYSRVESWNSSMVMTRRDGVCKYVSGIRKWWMRWERSLSSRGNHSYRNEEQLDQFLAKFENRRETGERERVPVRKVPLECGLLTRIEVLKPSLEAIRCRFILQNFSFPFQTNIHAHIQHSNEEEMIPRNNVTRLIARQYVNDT